MGQQCADGSFQAYRTDLAQPCAQPEVRISYVQRSYYQPVTEMVRKSYYEPVTRNYTSYYYEPVTDKEAGADLFKPMVGRACAFATALGVQAIEHHRKRVRFFSTIELVNQLESEKAKIGRAHV